MASHETVASADERPFRFAQKRNRAVEHRPAINGYEETKSLAGGYGPAGQLRPITG
jgi:hypothetical protein